MTLEFAQASHDLLDSVLIKQLAAINAASFKPSELQTRMLQSFGKGSHRLSYFTGHNKGNMCLDKDVALSALDELVQNKFLTVLSGLIYFLTFKGNEFSRVGEKPVATTPRTFTNSAMRSSFLGVNMSTNFRQGAGDSQLIKSLPMRSQIQRVVA